MEWDLNSDDKDMCDPAITKNVVLYLEEILSSTIISKSYTFIVLANVDTTGHRSRWYETEYNGFPGIRVNMNSMLFIFT